MHIYEYAYWYMAYLGSAMDFCLWVSVLVGDEINMIVMLPFRVNKQSLNKQTYHYYHCYYYYWLFPEVLFVCIHLISVWCFDGPNIWIFGHSSMKSAKSNRLVYPRARNDDLCGKPRSSLGAIMAACSRFVESIITWKEDRQEGARVHPRHHHYMMDGCKTRHRYLAAAGRKKRSGNDHPRAGCCMFISVLIS